MTLSAGDDVVQEVREQMALSGAHAHEERAMLRHVHESLNDGFVTRPKWQQHFVLQLGKHGS